MSLTASLRYGTDCDADGFDNGTDERRDVVLFRRVRAFDELQAEAEADDRLVTEQRYEQCERAGHRALQTERDALEQMVQRQSQNQYQ